MLRILKSEPIGDLRDRFIVVGKFLFGQTQHFQLYILFGRFSGLFLHQVAEIICRKTYLVGEILYRRNAGTLSLAGEKIVVDKTLEADGVSQIRRCRCIAR